MRNDRWVVCLEGTFFAPAFFAPAFFAPAFFAPASTKRPEPIPNATQKTKANETTATTKTNTARGPHKLRPTKPPQPLVETRRQRGEWPGIRRSGSMASRIGFPGNLAKSWRSPDSPPGRIIGERARLGGGSPEVYRSRRKRRAGGADGPRIGRPGSAHREISRNPGDRRLRIAGAFSVRGRGPQRALRKCTKVGASATRVGRTAPGPGGHYRRSVAYDFQEISRNPCDRQIRLPESFSGRLRY